MEWISVDDRLPFTDEVVLCCDIFSHFISLGKIVEQDEDEFRFELMYCENFEIDSSPTHWMPLPEPPKETYGMD